jgi:translation initiation factor 1 (eIF-1/SUI1)
MKALCIKWKDKNRQIRHSITLYVQINDKSVGLCGDGLTVYECRANLIGNALLNIDMNQYLIKNNLVGKFVCSISEIEEEHFEMKQLSEVLKSDLREWKNET